MDYTAYPDLVSFSSCGASWGSVADDRDRLYSVIADENPEIMEWLSPLDPRGRHQDVRADRLDRVGNWILETNEFQEWRRSEGRADKALLFCHGDPGVGKTYLR